MLEETKDILAIIFRDYWATPYQREKIQEKEKYERQKIEEEKLKKYNPKNIFKNKKNIIEKNEENKNLPIQIKKQKFYEKLINFLKNLFHIKNK